jgi:hypothetical protein
MATLSLDNSAAPVQEGDIIEDIDNDRFYLVEKQVQIHGLTRSWSLLCLNEGWSDIYGENGINRNFDVGFWRLKNP